MILVDAIAPRLLQLSLDSLDRRAAAPSKPLRRESQKYPA
jgi:hypothetical protein